MKPQSAKAKGRRLAKEIKKKLLARFRHLQIKEDDIQVTPSGCPGEDLLLSPAARALFPFSIECKNREKLNIWEAIRQAGKNNRKHPPMVIFSKNREKTYAVIEFDELLKYMGN